MLRPFRATAARVAAILLYLLGASPRNRRRRQPPSSRRNASPAVRAGPDGRSTCRRRCRSSGTRATSESRTGSPATCAAGLSANSPRTSSASTTARSSGWSIGSRITVEHPGGHPPVDSREDDRYVRAVGRCGGSEARPFGLSPIGGVEGQNNLHLDPQPGLSAIDLSSHGRLAVYAKPTFIFDAHTPTLQASHGDHSHGGREAEADEEIPGEDQDDTAYIGLGARCAILERCRWSFEVSPRIYGYRPERAAWNVGIEKLTRGHVLQLNFGNNFAPRPGWSPVAAAPRRLHGIQHEQEVVRSVPYWDTRRTPMKRLVIAVTIRQSVWRAATATTPRHRERHHDVHGAAVCAQRGAAGHERRNHGARNGGDHDNKPRRSTSACR